MAGMNAHGVKFQRRDETGTFTDVANVTNISGPSIEREEIDVTTHDSAGGWMEFIGGLKNGGEVSVDVNYRPADHDHLVADFEDAEPRTYRIVFPDAEATVWEFNAIMTGFEAEFPYDGKMEASLTFKVTGKPDLTASADNGE